MLNKDLIQQKAASIMNQLAAALGEGNADAASAAFQTFQTTILESIEAEFEQYRTISDMAVLQQRGLRTLTSEETEWYQKFIGAVKAGTRQAITDISSAMPVTIFDRTIEDMQREHPLLSQINIENAAGMMRIVMNGADLAEKLGTWGAVGSGFIQELTGKIKTADLTAAKYTAFFLVPKDFTRFNFTFAPMWVDQYVRVMLSASVAYGLEKSILTGDGKTQFIGMIMDTSSNAEGVYSAKSAEPLADFDEAYSAAVAKLAVRADGSARTFPEVLMVVNPVDYIKKIRRVQNAVTSAGIIDLLSLAYPTRVVQSCMIEEGKAVIGIAKNYFAAINGGTSGIVEFDDSAQFVEDNRVYTTRVYGNGMPVDNTSFSYLDISATEYPAVSVKVKGTVKTKEQV